MKNIDSYGKIAIEKEKKENPFGKKSVFNRVSIRRELMAYYGARHVRHLSLGKKS